MADLGFFLKNQEVQWDFINLTHEY